jgi:GAF domain-containing protein
MNKIDDKIEIYKDVVRVAGSLLSANNFYISDLANISALLKEKFGFWWVGFYWVKDNQLVLGPFQGPVACTHIALGKGVCGYSWQSKKTIIVKDVHQFPGHIACSAASQSEIVVPIFGSNREVIGVLDVDSEHLSMFDEIDQEYLEQICNLITNTHFS